MRTYLMSLGVVGIVVSTAGAATRGRRMATTLLSSFSAEGRGNATTWKAAVHPAHGRASGLSAIVIGTSRSEPYGGWCRLLRGRGRSAGPWRGPATGDGTWGWDETGRRHFRRRTILGWSQGRKYQGGTGAYRTDGPVVPDLIYATTSTINSVGRRSDSE